MCGNTDSVFVRCSPLLCGRKGQALCKCFSRSSRATYPSPRAMARGVWRPAKRSTTYPCADALLPIILSSSISLPPLRKRCKRCSHVECHASASVMAVRMNIRVALKLGNALERVALIAMAFTAATTSIGRAIREERYGERCGQCEQAPPSRLARLSSAPS